MGVHVTPTHKNVYGISGETAAVVYIRAAPLNY